MSLLESRNQICLLCSKFSFCIVHWGPDCKRQGGKRIPRMKSVNTELRWKADKQEAKLYKADKLEKFEKADKLSNQITKMFEPVKTKVMNW